MITEDYVSFEMAKLLKEKGFDEFTQKWYLKYKGEYSLASWGSAEHTDDSIDVPTLQMAMKWLRERHNIHPNIVVEVFGPYALYKIDRIFDGNEEKWVDFKNDENISDLYNTYEEACEAVIKYCLENLI